MFKKNPNLKYVFLGILAAFLLLPVIIGVPKTHYETSEITNFQDVEEDAISLSYSDFIKKMNEGKIDTVYAEFNNEAYSNTMFVTEKDNLKNYYIVPNPNNDTFKKELLENNIEVKEKSYIFDVISIQPSTKTATSSAVMLSSVMNVAFMIGMLYFLYIMLKKQGGIEDGIIGTVDKNSDKDTRANTEPKTFDEVGGLHALKQDLKTVVDFIKNQQSYIDAGAKLPRGILLVGPPGTGKTLLARVIAKEAGVNFLYMSASDFVEMYVGKGAARVRQLFKEARKQSPCIIFIDEIDTLCGKRGFERGEHSEDRKTLTALLAEMDGFKTSENILVIGATNRLSDIDEAATRPGRFTDIYNVPLPETLEERTEIIRLYMRNKKFSEDFNEKEFAREMIGRSPAEIEAVLNEAAIVSVKRGLLYINKECIEEAFYKRVMQGHQKDNKETDPRDLNIIAYHEAGHTLVEKLFGGEVTKVTIAPSTSGAGGVTFIQPSERKLYTKAMMEHRIMGLYAGRVAEYLYSGKNWDAITTGASNDIEQATKYLKNIVDNFGMSENGMVNMSMLSRETSDKSSEYIVELSKTLCDRTVEIIEEHYEYLEKIAKALLENETIYEDKINEILGDKVGILDNK